uniref:Uncharacterized protein n=1 Tax=Rhizophora mucronata TaxID=61149 RepID=A0A2P2NX20_RHIMU
MIARYLHQICEVRMQQLYCGYRHPQQRQFKSNLAKINQCRIQNIENRNANWKFTDTLQVGEEEKKFPKIQSPGPQNHQH